MPLDGAQWQIDILAADKTSQAFASATRNLNNLSSSQKNLADDTAALSTQLKEMGETISTVVEAAKAFSVILLGKELLDWHSEVTKSIGELKDQADAVGLSTDQLQAYQAAGRAAGASTQTMQRVLSTFNQALGQASAGEKSAADAFIKLKVPILDANGNLRDNAQLLTEAAKALLGIENPGQRAALAAQIFGREGKTLTPVLREIAQGMGVLLPEAMDRGQVASQETIDTFNDLGRQSEESRIRIANLYAQVAAPIQAAGMGFIARQMQEIADSIALADSHRGVLDAIMEVVNMLGAGLGGTLSGQSAADRALRSISESEATVVAMRRELAEVEAMEGAQSTTAGQAAVAAAKQRVTAAENELVAAQQVYQAWEKAKQARNEPKKLPEISVTGSRFAQPTGGERDRIAEEISKLQNEAKAARDAMAVLENANPNTQLMKDVEQAAEFQKKVGDLLATSGKYNPNDPRIQQLKDAAAAAVAAQQAEARLKETLELAYSVNAKFGDGKAALAKTQAELNDALARGWITQDAYNNATHEAVMLQEEQALRAKQYKEGLDGLAAGIQYAQLQQEKSNTAFNQGVELYNEGRQAFGSFMQQFNQDLQKGQTVWQAFGDAGLNALNRIADKLEQMAADQLWNAAFGGKGGSGGGSGGGLLGGFLDWLGLGGGSSGAANSTGGGQSAAIGGLLYANGGVFGPAGVVPFARGGIVDGPTVFPFANGVGLMGEAGPEAIMPLTRGKGGRLGVEASGVGSGGGGVTVNVYNTAQAKVSTRSSRSGPNGAPRLDILVEPLEAAIASRMDRGQGAIPKVLAGRYGVQPVGGSR